MAAQLAIHGGTPVRTKPFPSWPVYGQPEEQAVLRALRSGKWGKLDGVEVAAFERDFARYQGARHGIAVLNGTVAIQVALMAAGIKPGDEVIVPPYTFLATATAVVTSNATPVFADIELDTFNIDPKAIEALITSRTRAIIPVHFAGLPADMDAIMAIARRHNLVVIEDAAHAHAAEYKGRRAGSIGHMGTFSFQSSKNLTAGEGGFITTNDPALAEACREIHNCGRREGHAWYEHFVIAANFRLSEIQGALLNAQLQRLEEQARRRWENGRYLTEQLGQIPGIKPQKIIPECTRHAFHLYCFRIDAQELGAPRQAFLEALAAEGIPDFGGYPLPLYKQRVFLDRAFGPFDGCRGIDYAKTCCPNCEKICYEQGGWLEHRMLLGTREDMDDIVAAFRKVYENRSRLQG
ncbi:MAG TPA: DegT/DnrJ/EryC1/StrS family aminotransferase [Phycisphaerae bacterium]|nr:DegT/DnrJ/EryC1/StrS family aminotransferase [Phycisphaerae bacterium]HRR83814.1 DegT/DnrJ/EryC1/StrS family aminotransferase [Phycisphaerae bacterium]